MRIRSASALGIAAAALLGGVVAVLPATPALAATCPDNSWSIFDGRTGNYFNGNYINIRTGPWLSCTSVGQGQASHTARLDCWKTGSEGYTWSHLKDLTTGVQGWVRDDLLVGNGTLPTTPC